MIYIRTGDKVSKPFTIPLWFKILAALFACYFVWITVEYVKMIHMESEIARLNASATAKYELIDRLDTLIIEMDKTTQNADTMIEYMKKGIPE